MNLDRRLLPLVELASVLLTLSVIIGFRRLFEDDSFMRPLIVVALVTHGLAIGFRRSGRGLAVTALTSVVALVGLITVQHYRPTARAGFIPTGQTREAFRVDLRTAWDTFGEVAAPAEVLTGFVVLATIGIWLCAFLVDWAAFRLGSKIETLLPAAALFTFQAVVGGDRGRIVATACFGAAAVFFVLAHRVATLERDGRWLDQARGRGHTALLRGGAVLAGLATFLGLAVGPLLPGAEDEPLVQLDPSESGDGTRWVENPLVDIRSKLFDQSDAVMFTVTTSAQPDYWRMVSLHEFNGQQWSTSDNYVDADAELASGLPGVDSEPVNQQIAIVNLVSNWMPAAYEPRLVDSDEFTPNWSPNTGALLMPDGRPLEPGDFYTVVSEVPDRDEAAAATSSSEIPEEITDDYLDLPSGFSPRVVQEANDIVSRAGADTPLEQARALQDYFQSDRFTYNLEVEAGHSVGDIEQFLFDEQQGQQGYCEQFASSYAAMARSLGLPSRVAVGFTPGSYNPERGWYEVRGTNAHAWPEVWLGDAGWVRFEPTPDFGASRDQPMTGLPPVEIEERVSDPSDTDGVTVPTTTPPPTVTTPASPTDQQGSEAGLGFDGFAVSNNRGPWLTALFVLAVLAGAVALLLGAKHQVERKRRAHDVSVRLQVDRAWDDALDGLRLAGTNMHEAETANEFSHRASEHINQDAATELAELALLTTSARYGADDLADEQGERARHLAAGIRSYCTAQVSRSRRVAWELDPRPLFRPRR